MCPKGIRGVAHFIKSLLREPDQALAREPRHVGCYATSLALGYPDIAAQGQTFQAFESLGAAFEGAEVESGVAPQLLYLPRPLESPGVGRFVVQREFDSGEGGWEGG